MTPERQAIVSDDFLHEREASFHDAWASSTPLDKVLIEECFEAPTAMENRFIFRKMGDLRGKRVLDIGAGLGESSIYFAMKGAVVTTVDISPAMIEKIHELAQKYAVKIEGLVSTAESLNVTENQYDIVYVANTIHHVHDRSGLFAQIHRALKPAGVFFSIDPLAYNPVINLYRKMATEVRTPDEAPLTRADLRLAGDYFEEVGHREFWIASLFLFIKYYLVDRVHPNQDRYWKRILREREGSLWWWWPLRWLDGVLTRIPGVCWMSWNIVIWGRKPEN